MNEITNIHLGRQPFTISVDAYKELRDYLEAIKRRVGSKGKDVVAEVELRIAELLNERGVTGEKVVLLQDVTYIKEQLGKPGDFSDDNDDAEDDDDKKEDPDSGQKRLFRDPEHGIVAGVAAGLGAYFKIDTVFVRIIFVGLTVLWGWGIALYLVLWLITPEVKSKSDRLRSQGKAVTVENIKHVIDRADVAGATHRATRVIRGIVQKILRAILFVVGVSFTIAGVMALLGIMTAGAYILLRPDEAFQPGLFLVNGSEGLLVVLGLLAAGVVAAFLLLFGMAMIRRKWTLPGWVAAAMVGVFLVCVSVGAALTPGIVQDVRHRYEAAHHTARRNLEAFNALHVVGDSYVHTSFAPSDRYYLEIRYYGDMDPGLITATIDNGVLTVNPEKFVEATRCKAICFHNEPFIDVTVHAPSVDRIEVGGGGMSFAVSEPLRQTAIAFVLNKGSYADIRRIHAGKVEWISQPYGSTDTLTLSNLLPDATEDDYINISGTLYLSRTNELAVTSQDGCDEYNGSVYAMQMPQKLTINDKTFTSAEQFRAAQRKDEPNVYQCVTIEALGSDSSLPAEE